MSKRYKMASKKRNAKKGSHRRGKTTIHLIPSLMEAGGVVLPAFEKNPEMGNVSPYTQVKEWGAYEQGVKSLASNLTQWDTVKEPLALIVGGVVLKWIGKKTGLNKVGTKEVKIL